MGTYTFDLHTHLLEKKQRPEKLWLRAEEVGLDGIAITEHADVGAAEAYSRMRECKPRGMLLIPGIEINSDMGHVLAYSESPEIYEIAELLEEKVPLERLLEISGEENILLSISHPWGFNYDSFGFLMGDEDLGRLVRKGGIGVEMYNGIVGQVQDFVAGSGLIKRPRNFFEFLGNNRVTKKVGLYKVGNKVVEKIDEKSGALFERAVKTMELADMADFITAGSDAHIAERVGSGVIKINSRREMDNRKMLKELAAKENVIWAGPLVKESGKNEFESVQGPITRKEMLEGLKYITTSAVGKAKVGKRIKGTLGRAKVRERLGNAKSRIRNANVRERISRTFKKAGRKKG